MGLIIGREFELKKHIWVIEEVKELILLDMLCEIYLERDCKDIGI